MHTATQDDRVTLTRENLGRLETHRGGYTRQTLDALGIPWPPPRGWRRRLVGTVIDRPTFERLAKPLPAASAGVAALPLFTPPAIVPRAGCVAGVLFSDGACGPTNPGPTSCAFVLTTVSGRRIERRFDLGWGTSNSAEFHGLIKGLDAALDAGCTKVEAYLDSLIVVRAVNRATPRKSSPPHLQTLRGKARELMARFSDGVEVHWVAREDNSEADALSRSAPTGPSDRSPRVPRPERQAHLARP
jgi:ribonuclease HI